MVKIHFHKYQATGNDFVVIDNRSAAYSLSREQIGRICDRKFGIGADGLMLIEQDAEEDFNLVYYNSDGSQSLCGNGSRAAVHFASRLGIVNGKVSFRAHDGNHSAQLLDSGIVRLRMNNVARVDTFGEDHFINTGSPHYVRFVRDVKNFPVYAEGRRIRNDARFLPGGTNVNFAELLDDNTVFVRTYERGVEDETLSCGTGVVAAALAASLRGYFSPTTIKTIGGELSVEIKAGVSGLSSGQGDIFKDIFLAGPAKMVFEGDLEL